MQTESVVVCKDQSKTCCDSMVATCYVITLQLLVTAFASSGNRILLLALSTSITSGLCASTYFDLLALN